jgi:hypothetical protein
VEWIIMNYVRQQPLNLGHQSSISIMSFVRVTRWKVGHTVIKKRMNDHTLSHPSTTGPTSGSPYPTRAIAVIRSSDCQGSLLQHPSPLASL